MNTGPTGRGSRIRSRRNPHQIAQTCYEHGQFSNKMNKRLLRPMALKTLEHLANNCVAGTWKTPLATSPSASYTQFS